MSTSKHGQTAVTHNSTVEGNHFILEHPSDSGFYANLVHVLPKHGKLVHIVPNLRFSCKSTIFLLLKLLLKKD